MTISLPKILAMSRVSHDIEALLTHSYSESINAASQLAQLILLKHLGVHMHDAQVNRTAEEPIPHAINRLEKSLQRALGVDEAAVNIPFHIPSEARMKEIHEYRLSAHDLAIKIYSSLDHEVVAAVDAEKGHASRLRREAGLSHVEVGH